MSRTRTQDQPGLAGSCWRRLGSSNVTWTSNGPDELDEICQDIEHGLGKNNSFFLQSRGCNGARATGDSGGNINTVGRYIYNDYPSTRCVSIGHYAIPAAAVYLNSRAALLGRTGNSAPSFNLPVSFLELKDLPRMLKHAGDLLHGLRNPSGLNPVREAAAATLAYQFGWRPLLDDLKKALSFHDVVEKRLSAINRSVDNDSGVERSTNLGETKTETNDTVIDKIPSSGNVSLKRQITEVTETWGYVTWTPKDRIKGLGADSLRREAFRSALGLNAKNIPLATWKLLPWSWLIDWFANCSDMLAARQNMVDYKPSRGGICIHKRKDITHQGWSAHSSRVKITAYHAWAELKTRYAITTWAAITPTMKLPVLDSFKTSVLGSLAILKIVKT